MIRDDVRHLATHPFTELPLGPGFKRVDREGFTMIVNPWPMAQIVGVTGDGPPDVGAAVEEARAIAREHGKTIVGWWVAPEHAALAPELEELGLKNEDTPGFEAVENAMVLTSEPRGERVEGVDVRVSESWEDFLAGHHVSASVFGAPEQPEEELRARYEQTRDPSNPGRTFLARIDGDVVGSGFAVFGGAGVNLFGGAVLPEARGRGVYRALTAARWDAAVDAGTPALTVQAGRMSRPILEQLGFEFVAAARIYVDQVA